MKDTKFNPPGTLIYTGIKKTEKVSINLIYYDENEFIEKEIGSLEECLDFKNRKGVVWININGLHRTDIIENTGKIFNIHPVVLENILNIKQRPKIEEIEDYIFLIVKMLNYDEKKKTIISEQVSFILKENCLISFQERKGDVFDIIRERLRKSAGIIRKMGVDYLFYSLLDTIVDFYFLVIEKIGDRIEYLEDKILKGPDEKTLQTLYSLKRQTITLRRAVWPLRDIVNRMVRDGSSLIKQSTMVYLRDVYDHIIEVIDTVETLREMLSGMLELYLSSLSNRMNEIMKILTIMATIFIPLTLIAGIYGMNFKYMPELKLKWGYPAVLIFMLLTGISMLFYFRKKRWL